MQTTHKSRNLQHVNTHTHTHTLKTKCTGPNFGSRREKKGALAEFHCEFFHGRWSRNNSMPRAPFLATALSTWLFVLFQKPQLVAVLSCLAVSRLLILDHLFLCAWGPQRRARYQGIPHGRKLPLYPTSPTLLFLHHWAMLPSWEESRSQNAR